MEKKEFEKAVPRLREKLLETARFYLHDEEEAADAAQDSLLRLWIARSRLREGEEMFHLGNVVVRNLCIDRLRQAKAHPHESLTGHDQADGRQNAQAALEEAENEAWLRSALGSLPERYRAVLHMRQVEKLEMKDIARIMGATEAAARLLLSRARRQLAERLMQRRN